ncbi:MAG: hemolysin family protein [Hyphomicrobiales bacterium]|nr:hemolysin family protein [Hyphomicrobiales bacterium]
MDFVLALELLIFGILLALSGFFSSSETALFSLNKRQLEQMRHDDNPRINLIERLLSEPRRLIVTILIGNEFVNVAASVISAAIVIRLLGAESKLVNLLIMVPVLLLVGEITPKTLAIRNNVPFATFQSRPIELFAQIIAPLRVLIRSIADFFTTLVVGRERIQGSIVTEDMVRTLAREAVGEGVLNPHEARYIDQIFSFGDKTLEDIQTPRSNIFFLSDTLSTKEMFDQIRKTRHTKVPVFHRNRDKIVGVLHSRDLLGADLKKFSKKPDKLIGLLREPYIVSEKKTAAELFRAFRKRKLSVALTIDEYGGITGLVTMEDLLECIFGDIPSPSEAGEKADVKTGADGTRKVKGTMTIEQFNREFGAGLDADAFQTVGGMVLHAYGELPPEGAALNIGTIEFVVVEVSNNRIQELSAKGITEDEKGEGADAQPEPVRNKGDCSGEETDHDLAEGGSS